jgi:hypothetical protein
VIEITSFFHKVQKQLTSRSNWQSMTELWMICSIAGEWGRPTCLLCDVPFHWNNPQEIYTVVQEVRIPYIFRFLNVEATVLVWSYFALLSETTRNVFHLYTLFFSCIVWGLVFIQQWVLSLLHYGPWHCVIS